MLSTPDLWLDLPLDHLPLIALDLETTGWHPPAAAITEIALVPCGACRDRTAFTTLIDPRQPISREIQVRTGITPDMVRGRPVIEAVMPEVRRVLSTGIFVSHNVAFDWPFLDHAHRQAFGAPLSVPSLCTLVLARRLLSFLPSRSLEHVTRHFGVPLLQAHRAEADARAVAGILPPLLQLLVEHGYPTARRLVEAGFLRLEPPGPRSR